MGGTISILSVIYSENERETDFLIDVQKTKWDFL